jgi:hypothetical protein
MQCDSLGQQPSKKTVLKALQALPNVGESIAVDLWDLGIRTVNDLQGQDPEEMYLRLCMQRGAHIDRCMLYVLRAVIYIASNDEVDPNLRMWWKWKDPPSDRRIRP